MLRLISCTLLLSTFTIADGGTITTIATSSTLRPDTGTPFGDLMTTWNGPIISHGNVLFSAGTGGQDSLYFSNGGNLQFVAGVGGQTPGSSSYHFQSIESFDIYDGKVIFSGESFDDQRNRKQGIYLWQDGVTSVVADISTVLPGMGVASRLKDISIYSDRIAFIAESSTDPKTNSVMLYEGGTISNLLTGELYWKTYVSANSVFVENPGMVKGLLEINNSGVHELVNSSSILPDHAGGFGGDIYAVDTLNDNAVLRAHDKAAPVGDSHFGIYDVNSLVITAIYDQDTIFPSGATRVWTDGASYDEGHIAFLGYGSTDPASIYTDYSGNFVRVIGLGDLIDGKEIVNGVFSNKGLSGNQITAWGQFADGSSGIFVMSVPEISSIHLTIASLLLLVPYKRYAKVTITSR